MHVALGKKGVDAVFLAAIELGLGAAQHEQAGAARGQHGQVHFFGQGKVAGIGNQGCHGVHILAPAKPQQLQPGISLSLMPSRGATASSAILDSLAA